MNQIMKELKTKFFYCLICFFFSCGIPNDTVVLDPPNAGNRIDLTRYIADYPNNNSSGQFYPSELKGFNFYYRFFNPNSSSDKNYIPTGSTLDGDLITRLTSLGESSLSLGSINTIGNNNNKKGYNGFFKFYSKSEYENAGVTLLIDNINLNKKITIKFDFNITDGMKTPSVEYEYYTSATDLEIKKINLYRCINSNIDVSTSHFRTFDEQAIGYQTTKRYSFLPSDVDLKGNNSTADKSNTLYYVGVWCVAQGLTSLLQQIVSEPLFLGMRSININWSSIDEDNVSFGDKNTYLNNFE